jgi:hypothetical protein
MKSIESEPAVPAFPADTPGQAAQVVVDEPQGTWVAPEPPGLPCPNGVADDGGAAGVPPVVGSYDTEQPAPQGIPSAVST